MYVVFWFTFFPVAWCFLRFVHVVGDIVVPIYCSVVFVDLIEHSLFIHSPVDKYLACFWSLAITKRLLWTCECKFLCGHTFSYLGMGLLGHMGRLSLTFYKKLPNISKVTNILHSTRAIIRILVAPHLLQHYVFSVFLILAILVGV